MSTGLAIAATTVVLRKLLQEGLASAPLPTAISQPSVTALPPDRLVRGTEEKDLLNLFMYLVTPNPGWRDVDLPRRDQAGDRRTNQPLAIDLHYLLSAYGSGELNGEILLGYGMQLLHEMSILPPYLTQVFTPPYTGDVQMMQTLATAGLVDQVELIKITPYLLSTEEMSRMWTAFQDTYRPTAAYMASVVLIQTVAPVRTNLPVRQPIIDVLPLPHPHITPSSPCRFRTAQPRPSPPAGRSYWVRSRTPSLAPARR